MTPTLRRPPDMPATAIHPLACKTPRDCLAECKMPSECIISGCRRANNLPPPNDVDVAAAVIMAALRTLPGPRHAGAAIAVVRANLHLQAGGDTEEKVRAMIAEDDKACIEIWESIGGRA